MSFRRPKGRPIDGVLLLNKPSGISSNAALQQVKRLFQAAKAGHTGNLDPLATGVLPICLGETTKFSQFLLDSDKTYRSTFCLGSTTTTGDADGEILTQIDASAITLDQVNNALAPFSGEIEQVPPMYSALKLNGQPLYKLARAGKEVERAPRRVTIYSIALLDFKPGITATVQLDIHCSKGTYVRSIAEDLGQALGCGAHVATLHRLGTGPFNDAQTYTMEELRATRGEQPPEALDHLLLPIDAPIADWPKLSLPEQSVYYFNMGQAVMDPQVYRLGEEGDKVRVFSETGEFLGVAEITDDARIAPKRLISSQK